MEKKKIKITSPTGKLELTSFSKNDVSFSEFHISDYIKTDEDVHNLLAAEREPYEKALKTALVVLTEISEMTDVETTMVDPRYVAKRWANVIITRLKKEGIPDPTKLKEPRDGQKSK